MRPFWLAWLSIGCGEFVFGALPEDPSPIEETVTGTVEVDTFGFTSESLTLATRGAPGGSRARVEILAGSELLDRDESPVTGTVTVTLTSYNIVPSGGLMRFRRKRSVEFDVEESEAINGLIELAVGTERDLVASVPRGVLITIQVPRTATNGAGQPVRSGQGLRAQLLDPALGAWKRLERLRLPDVSPVSRTHPVTLVLAELPAAGLRKPSAAADILDGDFIPAALLLENTSGLLTGAAGQ